MHGILLVKEILSKAREEINSKCYEEFVKQAKAIASQKELAEIKVKIYQEKEARLNEE